MYPKFNINKGIFKKAPVFPALFYAILEVVHSFFYLIDRIHIDITNLIIK